MATQSAVLWESGAAELDAGSAGEVVSRSVRATRGTDVVVAGRSAIGSASVSRSSSARMPSSTSSRSCGGTCVSDLPVGASSVSAERRIVGPGFAGLNFGFLAEVSAVPSVGSLDFSVALLAGEATVARDDLVLLFVVAFSTVVV